MKKDASSIRIGKLFGIAVELHYSWFIVFMLLAYGLTADFFPGKYPGLSSGEYWTLGLVSALLLFVSVLFHEISHSLVAKKYKLGVEKINLFFFGGVAQIHPKQLKPKEELYMALAGPMFSVAFGLLFFIIYKTVDWVYLQAVSAYLYRINWVLASILLITCLSWTTKQEKAGMIPGLFLMPLWNWSLPRWSFTTVRSSLKD